MGDLDVEVLKTQGNFFSRVDSDTLGGGGGLSGDRKTSVPLGQRLKNFFNQKTEVDTGPFKTEMTKGQALGAAAVSEGLKLAALNDQVGSEMRQSQEAFDMEMGTFRQNEFAADTAALRAAMQGVQSVDRQMGAQSAGLQQQAFVRDPRTGLLI